MRKAFTLIEIIFTIVIMSGIFMVIPKIITAANKNESFSARQDAFFNALSLTKIAASLAWDENNSENLTILDTDIDTIPCDAVTHIRIGSFLSANGRTCKEPLRASTITSEEGGDYLNFDDVDDFDGIRIDTEAEGKKRYALFTSVAYLTNIGWLTTGNSLQIDLSTATQSLDSTNVKKLTTTVTYNGKKAIDYNKTLATFSYYSANLGQFTLNKREW